MAVPSCKISFVGKGQPVTIAEPVNHGTIDDYTRSPVVLYIFPLPEVLVVAIAAPVGR